MKYAAIVVAAALALSFGCKRKPSGGGGGGGGGGGCGSAVCTTELMANLGITGKIAIDRDTLYWPTYLNGGSGAQSIMKISVNGGTPSTLQDVSGTNTYQVAVAGDYVFFANKNGRFAKVSSGDGSVQNISHFNGPFAVAGDHVYFSGGPGPDDFGLYSVDFTQATLTPVAELAPTASPDPVIDGTYVYDQDSSITAPPAYFVYALSDGHEETSREPADPACKPVAQDDSNIYCAKARIIQYPKAGGTGITLATPLGSVLDSASDGQNFYFIDSGDLNSGKLIMRVPVGGGTPATLVASSKAATLALDDDSLYWTESDSQGNTGGLYKMTPK